MHEDRKSALAFSERGTDLSAWSLGDRQRLEVQFDLLRDDFNLWFDRALAHARLATDPAKAGWRALDAGCGWGQYTREIASRYPGTTVVGFDIDPESIAGAGSGSARPRFVVHDAMEPLPAAAVPDGGFDAVVAWFVLMWVPDKARMLRSLAAATRPGGVLLLANMADDIFHHPHPALARMLGAGAEALRLAGGLGLEDRLDAWLHEAGYEAVTTVRPRFPIGGATAWGRRWWIHWLASVSGARRAVVDVHGLMDGDEFDRNVEVLTRQSMIDHAGHFDYLYTVARRTGAEPDRSGR